MSFLLFCYAVWKSLCFQWKCCTLLKKQTKKQKKHKAPPPQPPKRIKQNNKTAVYNTLKKYVHAWDDKAETMHRLSADLGDAGRMTPLTIQRPCAGMYALTSSDKQRAGGGKSWDVDAWDRTGEEEKQ